MNHAQIEYIRSIINSMRDSLEGLDPEASEELRKKIDKLEKALDQVADHWVPTNK